MLDRTSAFRDQAWTHSPFGESISGRNLAHSKQGATARALVAADLVAGRRKLVTPTTSQASALCGVCIPYIRAALAANMEERRRLERGSLSLSEIVGHPKPAPVPWLEAAWANANVLERIDFLKVVGISNLADAFALAVA